MLIASLVVQKGFRKEELFDVTEAGASIAVLNNSRSTFELGGRAYVILRTGVVAPVSSLQCGEQVIATARQKPLVNTHLLDFDGREWTFKATNWTATQFGLFAGDAQVGTVSAGSLFKRLKEIPADFPDELPREVQMFLLAIFIWALTTSGD